MARLFRKKNSPRRPAAFHGTGSRSRTISFGQFVWIWNKFQRITIPEVHLKIIRWLSSFSPESRNKLLLMAFRGAGKSTLVALYCAWRIKIQPNIRILIVSGEEKLAEKMCSNVIELMIRHPVYPNSSQRIFEKRSKNEFRVKRSSVMRDPTLVARGLLGNLTGYRADLIVCDDVEVPNTAASERKRESLRSKLRELEFILNPHGTILYLGTPHGPCSIYPSEYDTESCHDEAFLNSYDRLSIPLLNSRGASSWPERFTSGIIDEIRSAIPANDFMAQMQLLPDTSSSAGWSLEGISFLSENNLSRSQFHSVISEFLCSNVIHRACFWDISFGHPEKGDRCAIASVLQNADGMYLIEDVRYLTSDVSISKQKSEVIQLCEQVADFVDSYQIQCIHVEQNGIGQFVPSLLRNHFVARNIKTKVVGHCTTKNKNRKIIEALEPLIYSNKMVFMQHLRYSQFFIEMKNWRFNKSCKDDGIDAVASCIHLMPRLLQSKYSSITKNAISTFEIFD